MSSVFITGICKSAGDRSGIWGASQHLTSLIHVFMHYCNSINVSVFLVIYSIQFITPLTAVEEGGKTFAVHFLCDSDSTSRRAALAKQREATFSCVSRSCSIWCILKMADVLVDEILCFVSNAIDTLPCEQVIAACSTSFAILYQSGKFSPTFLEW